MHVKTAHPVLCINHSKNILKKKNVVNECVKQCEYAKLSLIIGKLQDLEPFRLQQDL